CGPGTFSGSVCGMDAAPRPPWTGSWRLPENVTGPCRAVPTERSNACAQLPATEEAGNGQQRFGRSSGRIEPARGQFAAQPGELALGELAGGGDGLGAEGGGIGEAVQMAPGLAVADRAHGWQLRVQARVAAQAADLVQEAGLEHGLEAQRDALVQLGTVGGGDHQAQDAVRERTVGAVLLPVADRPAAQAVD